MLSSEQLTGWRHTTKLFPPLRIKSASVPSLDVTDPLTFLWFGNIRQESFCKAWEVIKLNILIFLGLICATVTPLKISGFKEVENERSES